MMKCTSCFYWIGMVVCLLSVGGLIPAHAAADSYPASVGIQTISIDVSGNVTDASGEPLIGVNIQVKGSNQGTATDLDGRFTLENVANDAILVFSYVGYHTQEVPVDSRTSITVVLEEDTQT